MAEVNVVATMPAADATRVAKLTAQATGLPVSELDMSGMLLGAQIGSREHITVRAGADPSITPAGRAALQDLTVWIDSTSLYVVRGNVSPSPSARYLGAPPEAYFAQSVLKYQYS
jgi:hypothetical protein